MLPMPNDVAAAFMAVLENRKVLPSLHSDSKNGRAVFLISGSSTIG
jgi:hypothetical protein